MSETLNIALLGCGTVGGGVVKLLTAQRQRFIVCGTFTVHTACPVGKLIRIAH